MENTIDHRKIRNTIVPLIERDISLSLLRIFYHYVFTVMRMYDGKIQWVAYPVSLEINIENEAAACPHGIYAA